MAFRTGLSAMQTALDDAEAKAEAARSGGSFGPSLNYFSWKDGDKKILRFLADDMLIEDVYDFIMDNQGKMKTFMVDPDDPHRLQRYMSPSPGIGWKQDFKTRQLVEPKTRKIGACVAVLRTEVVRDGKTVIEDEVYDKTIDDVTYQMRTFGVVNQSLPNFWHPMAKGFARRYGTICDRDYEITRDGNGIDTKYSIIPLDPDPDLDTPEKVAAFYFYGQPWDKEDPLRFLKCPMTTVEWAQYYSSEERHKHWLTPTGGSLAQQASGNEGINEFHKDTTHNDEAQASVRPPSSTSFSSLKDTLLNGNK